MTNFFTDKELKIRKKWLISMFVLMGFQFLQAGVMSSDFPNPFPFFAFVGLFVLGIFGLLYYFSYKKNGFVFLQTILLYPLWKMGADSSRLKSLLKFENTAELVPFIIILALYGWWYFISFKLILLNMSLKPSRKCKKAMAQMQTAQTIEELDLKFHDLMNEFPKFERVILKEYQEKKESLINTSKLQSASQVPLKSILFLLGNSIFG